MCNSLIIPDPLGLGKHKKPLVGPIDAVTDSKKARGKLKLIDSFDSNMVEAVSQPRQDP